MKSILRLLVVALVVLTFSGVSFAQVTPATPATPAKKMEKKAEKPKATSIVGEIISVDAKAGTLTVKAKDKEMSFTAETKAAKAALEKVKVGDGVRVSYNEKNGKLIARSVAVAKAKGKAVAKVKGKETAAQMKEEGKGKTK